MADCGQDRRRERVACSIGGVLVQATSDSRLARDSNELEDIFLERRRRRLERKRLVCKIACCGNEEFELTRALLCNMSLC